MPNGVQPHIYQTKKYKPLAHSRQQITFNGLGKPEYLVTSVWGPCVGFSDITTSPVKNSCHSLLPTLTGRPGSHFYCSWCDQVLKRDSPITLDYRVASIKRTGCHLPNYSWGCPHGRGSKSIKLVSQQSRKLLAPQFPLAEPATPDYSLRNYHTGRYLSPVIAFPPTAKTLKSGNHPIATDVTGESLFSALLPCYTCDILLAYNYIVSLGLILGL